MKRFYIASKEVNKSEDIIRDINDAYHSDIVKSLSIIQVYDVEGIIEDSVDLYNPLVEEVVSEIDLSNKKYIWFRSLNGQYNQNSFNKIRILESKGSTNVNVDVSTIYVFDDNCDLNKVKDYLINPLEYEIFNGEKRSAFIVNKKEEEVIEGFIDATELELKRILKGYSLSMNIDDLIHIQNYFNSIKRNPNITELLMLDTYWSDHCRHTTFETELVDIEYKQSSIKDEIEDALKIYLELRDKTKRLSKPQTLMDIASIEARYEKGVGLLDDIEESEEINACSIEIDVDVDGVMERWLLMYKNETHNHPTEIEPYGGASTCVGGAIRDPLSGRSYVYQAMRLTGAGNIKNNVSDKVEGKLAQRFITKRAALGNSSYANQIGSTTSYVREFYNDGYVAKRMELGAVVGAIKKSDVTRQSPSVGDKVIILGAPTGKDGVGAATGSSKKNADDALENAFAQVQKGNAMEERKIQRLFKRSEVSKLIKKANDLGAGGVSVAIGELADGVHIQLENIYTKYDGLTPSELALSESQERMVVVVDSKDESKFLEYCVKEDLLAASVAYISDDNKLVMKYYDDIIVDIDRSFLDTNGVRQKIAPIIIDSNNESIFNSNKYLRNNFKECIEAIASDINNSNQKNLSEMFDSTGQRNLVLAMYGGKYLRTLSEVSAQKIPCEGYTNTVSLLAHGLNPDLGEYQPFYAGSYSIVEAVSRLVAVGLDYKKIRLSLQEYFESVTNNQEAFGKPVAALLGALKAQRELELPALGGKDSMSGNFDDIKVPPTIACFGVGTTAYENIISNEFKGVDNYVYVIISSNGEKIDYDLLRNNYKLMNDLHQSNRIITSSSIKDKGVLAEIINMSYGNNIGVDMNSNLSLEDMTCPSYGSFIIESRDELNNDGLILIGRTCENNIKYNNEEYCIEDIYQLNKKTLDNVFYSYSLNDDKVKLSNDKLVFKQINPQKEVKVFIPIFYGTNNEDELIKAFTKYHTSIDTYQFIEREYEKGIDQLVNSINNCNVLVLCNLAFSEDDFDGNTKFVYNLLHNKEVKKAVEHLINRGGIIYGMGSAFKVLLELGLLIDNHYTNKIEATLSSNASYIAQYEESKVINNDNLFFKGIDGNYLLPYSGGYSGVLSNRIINENQVVSTINGNIEAMVSSNGQVLGRLCFSERYEEGTYLNMSGNLNQNIVKNIVRYFLED